MDEATVEKKIREYIPDIIHMSLATCYDKEPWISEVHFVYDDELNLYFRSKPSRRHSLEIEKNSNVAGNIIAQHSIDQKVRGVYFEGTAVQIDDVRQGDDAYELYCARFGTGAEILDEAMRDDGHKFYKVTVSTFYLFDSREVSPGQKYTLPWSTQER